MDIAVVLYWFHFAVHAHSDYIACCIACCLLVPYDVHLVVELVLSLLPLQILNNLHD